MKNEYKTLSSRVKLLLNREEGFDVDWKQGINGLDSEDIVAFANSKNGGSIIIGVAESVGIDGRQKAEIVGCKCSDRNKMNIKNKALNCIPPIAIEIIKENTNETPFYRLEIPSGANKPYCTQKGIYKIREDGHNKAITPNELLLMFMDLESDKFIKRFKEAAEEIQSNLFAVSRDVDEALTYLGSILPQIEDLEEYSYMSDEILGTVTEIQKYVGDFSYDSDKNERRILAILDHLNIEDPLTTDFKKYVKDSILLDAEIGKNIKNKKYLEKLNSRYSRLTKEELKSCYKDALVEIENTQKNE